MFALAFLLAVDAFAALALFADGALKFANSVLSHEEPYPLPPHTDPQTVTRYRDDVLDPLRADGDPLADDLIAEIAKSGAAGGTPPGGVPNPFGAKSAGLPKQGGPPLPGVDGRHVAVKDFYDTLLLKRTLDLSDFGAKAGTPADPGGTPAKAYEPQLRTWAADALKAAPTQALGARLERGGNFFKKNLAKIIVILSTASLLEAFACRRGVQVLASTDYLSRDANRRLYETMQFVLYVNEPDGFKVGGKAIAAIQRVRLMHACIRWILLNTPAVNWQKQWGKPINAEDLLGMQMGFSGLVIRDLARLWVTVTEEESDDHLFLWNVVGQLLGAPTDLRPDGLGEALALIRAIERRQFGPSEQGSAMTDALLDFHKDQLQGLFKVALYLMHRLAGEPVCKMLGVPVSPIASAGITNALIDGALKHWGMQIVFHSTKGRQKLDVPRSLQSVFDEYRLDQVRKG